MPRRSKVKYAPAAVDDMDEIFSYISQDNLSAAEALLEKLHAEISHLEEFPNMGSVLSEEEFTLVNSRYRFIVVHPYLVFYRIVKNGVVIHRILHSRRGYIRELFTIEE